MSDPLTRREQYYSAILGEMVDIPEPKTREEEYLLAIYENGGGGGGGGTTNYNSLSNKPRINGVELTGNKISSQLGLEGTLTWDTTPTQGSNKPVRSGGVYTSLAGKVDKVAGKGLSTADFTNEEKIKLASVAANADVNIIEKITLNGVEIVPVNKVVALTVMTRTVSNLQNYYLKSETYTQDEVNALINSISSLTLDIVETLPETDISSTTIYLVPVSSAANVYMQYAYINNEWAQLGTTQVDLSNYYTKAQVDALLADKQDELTFDDAPESGSDNPVKSGGIYNALAAKQDTLSFDTAPTEDSTNPVTSGAVYSALADKQDTLVYDEAPTLGSNNMVTSGAVAEALDNVSVAVATEQDAGIVKPDGVTISVDDDGTLHGSSGIVPDEEDFDFTEGVLSLQTSRRVWTGTQAEWDALSTAEKQRYSVCNITDDESDANVFVDEVTSGDMHGVTSNAVADAIGWKSLGRKSISSEQSNVAFSMPSEYKELLLIYGTPYYQRSDVITYDAMQTMSHFTTDFAGGIVGGSAQQQVVFTLSKTGSVSSLVVRQNGSENTGFLAVYYR